MLKVCFWISQVSNFRAFAEEKREKYSILSVPCIIINDDIVDFGKKDASEIVTLLEKI